jgi:prepilin-type N-terminal cleavage/methylation domain-containing protein
VASGENARHPSLVATPHITVLLKELAVRSQYAKPWKKRAAFTLIEILVVIAIIAILASLLLAGVMAVLYKGPEARLRNDIMQLSNQLTKFHADKGFYPPDRIILRPNFIQYGNTGLDAESRYYLGKMFPNIGSFTNMAWAGYQANGSPVQTPVAPNDFWTLEGDQCLVFFLGGIPDANGKVTGFSNNPKNPTQAGGDRIKWYDFEGARLTTQFRATSPFPSFLDPFLKKPYVYFSSGRKADNYNTAIPANVTFNVSPYIQTAAVLAVPPNPGTPAKYWNSTTFQIIAAANDGAFGPGGVVWPSFPVAPAANDDYSNFHDSKLGAP